MERPGSAEKTPPPRWSPRMIMAARLRPDKG